MIVLERYPLKSENITDLISVYYIRDKADVLNQEVLLMKMVLFLIL